MADLHRGKSVYGDGAQLRDVVGYGANMVSVGVPLL